LYARQVAYASRLVADAAGYTDFDQVWQSRSGPPQVPWLEPDVADHLSALAAAGTEAVIVCPIGFVADHIEVVWDLDHELRLQAQEAGIAFARAATPNAQLARVAADLIDELRTGREPVRVNASMGSTESPPLQGFSLNGALCTPLCGP
jgi:ferrochelatase